MIKTLITEWYNHTLAVQKETEQLEAVGFHVEAPIFNTIYELHSAYTNLVAERVGDKEKWLNYFQYECDMGEKPMLVICADAKEIILKDIDTLIEVLQ